MRSPPPRVNGKHDIQLMKQAVRAWSPSVCVSQWRGKNEFMTKSFLQNHAKINKSQPLRVCTKMVKTVKSRSRIDKKQAEN